MVGLERLLIGRTLCGRYAVEELIGRGRGGLVYRARDAGGAEVALKVLAAPPTAEGRERYRRLVAGEVRLAASIQHPNVVTVHALETDPELDLDFVTAELARGQTLASVLAQRGKPPISLGLRLLGDAAEGLAAGHRAGLVHRDLRPASLYLVRSEAERQVRVKVAGFGIPQLVRRESLAAAPPEVSAYASPEMLANGSTRLTAASDVFSLGAIGFELMTGAPPLDEAARRALAEGRPVEIDAPLEVPPAVPPHVFDAVLHALRITPAERFRDAGAFAEALRQPAVRPSVTVPAVFPTPAVAAPAAPAEAALAETAPTPDAAPAEPRNADAAVAPEAPAAPQEVAPAPVPAEIAPRAAHTSPAVQPTRAAPMPRAVPADLELYYPPQRTSTPAAASHPAEAPAAPVAAQASVPAAPPSETATAPDESERVPSTAAAAAAVAATPAVTAAAPAAAVEKPAIAPRPVSIGGGARRKPAGAGARNVRGPAMAAGFVLGMLVLGTVGWMATHTTGADAASPEKQAANRLASGAPAASAPTAAAPGAEPQPAAATPAADTAAGTAEARRRALEEAKKRQQDEARKKQQEEQARLALLQQQQAAAAAQAAPQQPAARPQAVTPPPVQQPVAVVQRPAPPAAPPPAPPPAAPPAREEPAPAREAASNEVFASSAVEERPRLSNGAEIQRALQMRYPDQLAGARVSGAVMATFVVNADGRIDGSSIRIVSSPNPAFNVPTQNVLRRARFRPATVGGQPVRVQVTMPVQWTPPQ